MLASDRSWRGVCWDWYINPPLLQSAMCHCSSGRCTILMTGRRRFHLRPISKFVLVLLYTESVDIGSVLGITPRSGSFGAEAALKASYSLLVMDWMMEQAIFENRIRNLLWLLRSAAPSCQVFGLDDAVARSPAKEQSTAEIGPNDVRPLRETIDFGAYAEAGGRIRGDITAAILRGLEKGKGRVQVPWVQFYASLTPENI